MEGVGDNGRTWLSVEKKKRKQKENCRVLEKKEKQGHFQLYPYGYINVLYMNQCARSHVSLGAKSHKSTFTLNNLKVSYYAKLTFSVHIFACLECLPPHKYQILQLLLHNRWGVSAHPCAHTTTATCARILLREAILISPASRRHGWGKDRLWAGKLLSVGSTKTICWQYTVAH